MSIPLHPPFLEEEALIWLPAPSQLGTLVAQLLGLTAPLTEPSEPPALLSVVQLARGLPSLSLPTDSENLKFLALVNQATLGYTSHYIRGSFGK